MIIAPTTLLPNIRGKKFRSEYNRLGQLVAQMAGRGRNTLRVAISSATFEKVALAQLMADLGLSYFEVHPTDVAIDKPYSRPHVLTRRGVGSDDEFAMFGFLVEAMEEAMVTDIACRKTLFLCSSLRKVDRLYDHFVAQLHPDLSDLRKPPRFARLSSYTPDREKRQILAAFKAGEIDYLFITAIGEHGMDFDGVTLMFVIGGSRKLLLHAVVSLLLLICSV
jgi:superfamily II DNA/RNA helicase